MTLANLLRATLTKWISCSKRCHSSFLGERSDLRWTSFSFLVVASSSFERAYLDAGAEDYLALAAYDL